MVKIKFDELEFDHIVEFTKDNTLFAAARENCRGRIRLFLVNRSTGNVYGRNGRVDSWEELYGRDRTSIIARVTAAKNKDIPVYKLNATNGSI